MGTCHRLIVAFGEMHHGSSSSEGCFDQTCARRVLPKISQNTFEMNTKLHYDVFFFLDRPPWHGRGQLSLMTT